MRLVVAIPTRDRPAMLRRCLDSLAACRAPDGIAVEIVAIDNASGPAAAAALPAIVGARVGPHPARLLSEPRAGHPFARNRALQAAQEAGADLLFFIDDDQTAPPDMLAVAVEVLRAEAADAVKPETRWEFEPPARLRAHFEPRPRPGAPPARNARATQLATNGVLIARRLWDRLGLRFDERHPLNGGEDVDFFARAHRLGARLIHTRATFVTEFCPAAKQTRRWLLRSAYRVGNSEALRRVKRRSRAATVLRNAPAILPRLLAALLLAPFSAGWLRHAMKAAKAAGAVTGALGVPFHAYRRVLGA